MDNKPNTGAIFKNTWKKPGDNKPDYKGMIDVDGQPKEISLWLSSAKDKPEFKYFSVRISEPYQPEQPADAPEPQKQEQKPDLMDEFTNDLPF